MGRFIGNWESFGTALVGEPDERLGEVAYLVGGLRPAWLVGAPLGAGALLVAVTYFAVFWSGAGRTPGMHLVGIRVQDASGRPPSPGRALVRAIVTWPSIAVAFLGYAPVLFDGRRGLPRPRRRDRCRLREPRFTR